MNIQNITQTHIADSQKFLGTEYKAVDLTQSAKTVFSVSDIKKILHDAGLKELEDLLNKIKDSKDLTKETKEQLKELLEKIKKAAEKFGLRLELGVSKEGDALVRIFNRLNNRLIATIPMQILLRTLIAAQNREHRGGKNISTPQAIESAQDLKQEISSVPTGTDIVL